MQNKTMQDLNKTTVTYITFSAAANTLESAAVALKLSYFFDDTTNSYIPVTDIRILGEDSTAELSISDTEKLIAKLQEIVADGKRIEQEESNEAGDEE